VSFGLLDVASINISMMYVNLGVLERAHSLLLVPNEKHSIFRFNEGPRIPGARYFDMDDIATSKELFPDLNPKGLHAMFPPEVCKLSLC
jgi:hypothetical protein